MTGVLDALGPADPCRVVAFRKSAQIGGSVVAQVFLLASLVADPGYLLYVHPTEDNAQRWAKMKFRPMIRQTPAANACMGSNAFANLSYVERADGRGAIQISGAASESSLSMVSMRRQVQDDLAKWENNNAGDPEEQADSRSMAFADAKILKLSTPLVEPGCRISRAFYEGTQEYYHVPCPHCGHEHPLEWDNFHPDKDRPERSFFSCPSCGGVIEQAHRREMVALGRWVASRPERRSRTRSFHLWAAYSPLVDWALIADRWSKAEGDPDAEKTFFNDVLGLAYKAPSEAPEWEKLKERADAIGHRRGVIPYGHPVLTLGIDVQGERVEWHAEAFGPDRHIATVDYGVIQGNIVDEVVRERLDDLIKRSWVNEAGRRIPVDLTAIDANAYTDDVMDWSRRHAKVINVRGAQSDNAPPLAIVRYERDRKGKALKRRGKFYHVGVSELKLSRYKNLKKTDPLVRGFIAIPRGMDDVFFRQYTAERRIPKKSKNPLAFTPYQWVLPEGERNEVLDTSLYAEAAAIRFGIREFTPLRWEALATERETPLETGQMDMDQLLLTGLPVAEVVEPEKTMPPPVVDRAARIAAMFAR